VAEPASIIIVWEGLGTDAFDAVVPNPWLEFDTGSGAITTYSFWYGFGSEGVVHNEGLNYAYLDGHAKWVKSGSSQGAFTALPGTPGWGLYWSNFGWYTGLQP
jgi:prepilin-type processing-associated H-X9-DG protein